MDTHVTHPVTGLTHTGRLLLSCGAIALSSALIALSAPEIGGQPLWVWLAFAPWLYSLRWLSPLLAALSGLAMGLGYIVPEHWGAFSVAAQSAGYAGLAQAALVIAFFLTYALPFMLFGGLDRSLQRYTQGALQPLALLRAGVLTSLVSGFSQLLSPFPYTPVSAITDSTKLLQLAAIGGEPLLLLLLLWPSALLAGLFGQRVHTWRQLARAVTPLALSFLAVTLYGGWRIDAMDRSDAAGAGVRLSVLPLQLDLPAYAASMMLTRDRPGATISALELSRAGLARAPRTELVLWPETPLAIAQSEQVCAIAQQLSDRLGRPLLMHCARALGNQHQYTLELRRPTQTEPMQTEVVAVHAKSALVPIYEQPLWGIGPIAPGEAGTVFAFDARRRLIPALCYELHARGHIRAGVLAGGNIIVHSASYTPWNRHPIDLWNQRMAQLRAVEFGVPIVSASNRAASGWIDANGRLRSQTARFGRQAEGVDVWSPDSNPTLQTYLQPVLAWLPMLGIWLVIAVKHWLVRRRQGLVREAFINSAPDKNAT